MLTQLTNLDIFVQGTLTIYVVTGVVSTVEITGVAFIIITIIITLLSIRRVSKLAYLI